MPVSILRQLLLLMPTEIIEREVTQAGEVISKLLPVDIRKFKRDIQSSVINSALLRRDCYLWFIILNLLHDDVYLARLTEHEPEHRKSVFLKECIKISYTYLTSGSIDCEGIFPRQLHNHIPHHQITPTIAVEYLTLVYAQL